MSTALAPVADESKPSPLPAFTGAQMARALAAYRELQAALDASMPDQIMNLDGKPFRRKQYWRAVAVASNTSVELVEERREVFGDPGNYVWIVVYKASTPTGRTAIGDGICSASEKSVGRMRATEHNVRSHAHTRAFNRAVSNLVGFGEVSAEELEDAPKTQPMQPRRPAVPLGYRVIDQFERDGRWFHVYLGDPPEHFKTSLPKTGELLKRAYEQRAPVSLQITKNKTAGEPGYVNRVT